ncbi:hypothetical protein [Azospirillum brasilense]|uniref:Uncharacterized protein n=1 Tax=Azospirillum brasilense TaxID=192 RepID=A0A235HGG1_AZOBR|nr:hypothetical protein [Azospirillum brasilense]OYD84623.1 hypothetical protein CHT98_09195 [Azospirillum brasilense]
MRRLTLIAAAAATLLAAPAFANDLKTGGVPVNPMMMQPGFGSPFAAAPSLSSTNVGIATNLAAGIGNKAKQNVFAMQQGTGGSLVNTNVGVATNVAAGIGNKAKQNVTGVTFGFGKGGLLDTNVGVTTNVGAGIGNTAGQNLFGLKAQ